LFVITACDPVTVAVGGAAIAGVEATRNQHGVGGAISDSEIQTKINSYLAEKDPKIFERIELCVKHGNVVAIGYMKNQEQCEKALQLIKCISGYRNLFNEIKVQSSPTAKNVAVDSSITSRIKSAMAFDGNIYSLNYDVTTVKGIVYICGTAQSKYERDVVLNCARTTSGAEKVCAYIAINKNSKE
jgi:osmotically-inducible protein OsmY